MLQACADARSSIRFEQYVLDPDTIGKRFIHMFIRKAHEGVSVQLLLDWYGSRALYASDEVKRMTDAGIHIRFFRPPSPAWLLRGPRLLPRDHRKMLMIDDRTTFIGGVCVYDATTDWRDTMIELSGTITQQCLHIFNQTWLKISQDECSIKAHPDFETDMHVSVYANAPDSDEHLFTDALIEKIYHATDHIILATPYFTPGRTLLPALTDALKRGVRLDIILSDQSKYAPYVVGKALCGTLIQQGACIYYYKPSMLHLKMMIIDHTWAAIGSCNLDGLSMHRNQEVMLTITCPDVITTLHTHIKKDISESSVFSYTDWKNRPLSQKISARLLSPFKSYL